MTISSDAARFMLPQVSEPTTFLDGQPYSRKSAGCISSESDAVAQGCNDAPVRPATVQAVTHGRHNAQSDPEFADRGSATRHPSAVAGTPLSLAGPEFWFVLILGAKLALVLIGWLCPWRHSHGI